jgi:hypothetical protein
VDLELREALDRLSSDLRAEIQASALETRRHFDVVAESLRADVRGLAEGLVLFGESSNRRFADQADRSIGLEGRVLSLEVRVTTLERNRKLPRRRRRP